jgi:hypothetical protein
MGAGYASRPWKETLPFRHPGFAEGKDRASKREAEAAATRRKVGTAGSRSSLRETGMTELLE